MKLSNHKTWTQRGRRPWEQRCYRRQTWPPWPCCLGPRRWGQHRISPILISCSTWLVTVWHPQGTLFGAGQRWGLLVCLPGVMQVPPLFHSSQHQGFPRTQVARAQPPKSFLLAPELRFLQLLESPTPSPHSCFTGTKPRRRKTMRKRNEYNPIPL